MYHFQTWIQWQQTVRKQRALSRARTRMIRAVGEARLPGWWIIVCAMGTMPAKIAMCPPVTWSDQSRMFARRSHSVWAWFLQRQNVKRVQLLSFVSVQSPHARRGPPELSKCKYGNYSRNVDSVSSLSATNTLRPLQACPRLSSPLSLRPLSLSLSKSLSCSVTLAQWTPPDTHTLVSWYSGQDHKNEFRHSQMLHFEIVGLNASLDYTIEFQPSHHYWTFLELLLENLQRTMNLQGGPVSYQISKTIKGGSPGHFIGQLDSILSYKSHRYFNRPNK